MQTWFELLAISKIEAYGRFIDFDSASTSPLFMRVMAYVETRDGAHADPNGGGIWNVEDALFRSTQDDHRLNDIIMQLKTAKLMILTLRLLTGEVSTTAIFQYHYILALQLDLLYI